ncbi:putative Zn-dependent protease [Arthrobacter sp. GAS37]|uniref:metallopeptidase TldD-related protein n=1 Tax=Arthrobacter sp. GAS37 TaxID=3156261 RepID=UPI003839BDC6
MELDEIKSYGEQIVTAGLGLYAESSFQSKVVIGPKRAGTIWAESRLGAAARILGSTVREVAFGLQPVGGVGELVGIASRYLATLPAGHHRLSPHQVPTVPEEAHLHQMNEIVLAQEAQKMRADVRIIVEHNLGTTLQTVFDSVHETDHSYRRASVVAIDKASGRQFARTSVVDVTDGKTPFPAAQLIEMGRKLEERVGALASRPKVPPGLYMCRFDSSAAATLTHEVFGHLLEADNIRIAQDHLETGSKIAPGFINIRDDGQDQDPWVRAAYDDLGNQTRSTELICGGEVHNFLGASDSQANHRREHADQKAMPRMRSIKLTSSLTTDLDLGMHKQPVLRIKEILSAMFLPRTGTFLLELGESILVDGDRATQFSGGRVRSSALELLCHIVTVGSSSASSAPEYCFKKEQKLRTLSSSPELLIAAVPVVNQ